MNLSDLIYKSAFSGLNLQDPTTRSMPADNNGSHEDVETPVRNTSHWLITFSVVSQAFE